jgi:HSP20 family molecular chaperone IbpA
MQNNPNSPYDDVFNNLAKIVEDIVKNMPDSRNARIVGYTIITRNPSNGEPGIFRQAESDEDEEIPYEVIESDDRIFITVTMPADSKNAPLVDIQANSVRVDIANRNVSVILDHPVDRIHSYYRIHRGIMDITLKKVTTP